MAQTLHFGKITCLIIFVQRDLSFGGLSLVVPPMSWTIEISPKAQRVLYELDAHACCFLMDALSFDLMKQVNYTGTAREIWESIKDTFGDSSIWDDGKFKKEDEPKKEAHECVEHSETS